MRNPMEADFTRIVQRLALRFRIPVEAAVRHLVAHLVTIARAGGGTLPYRAALAEALMAIRRGGILG